MALSHIRHNIQVKEESEIPFFSKECCKLDDYNLWPIRCSKHNKELKSWQRKNKHIKKWKRLFYKNFQRWRFVKMLTITTPPVLHWDTSDDLNLQTTITPEKITERMGIIYNTNESYYTRSIIEKNLKHTNKSDYQIHLREILKSRFKLMRKRSKFWKKYVDGGQWFYECPIDENGIANPHLHVLLVGSKKIPIEELSEEFSKYKLGEVSYFSSPRNKNGVIQKMTYWRNRKLVVNKSAVSRSLNYVSNYMKKDEQADGKNNSWFGSLYNK